MRMISNRPAPGKKLIRIVIIASLLFVGVAYGDGASAASGNTSQSVPVQVNTTVPTGTPTGANADTVPFGNGVSGSSRSDGAGGGKVSTPAVTGNAGVSGSPAGQVIATPIGVAGTNVATRGMTQEITVDTRTAQAANETVSVSGTAVNIEKGPVTLTIATTAGPAVKDGTITAGIKSITMNYAPVTAQFAATGPVAASFAADLKQLPSRNATIAASLSDKPDLLAQAAFDSAVKKTGYQIDAIAYSLLVAKTDLPDGTEVGVATVNMSVSPAWVGAHGGAGQIKITRCADDGTSQVLDTRSAGTDSAGNTVFTGTSPGGLSIFALVSVKTPPAQAAITPQPTSPVSMPFTGANSMLLVPPLVVFVIVMFMRRRR